MGLINVFPLLPAMEKSGISLRFPKSDRDKFREFLFLWPREKISAGIFVVADWPFGNFLVDDVPTLTMYACTRSLVTVSWCYWLLVMPCTITRYCNVHKGRTGTVLVGRYAQWSIEYFTLAIGTAITALASWFQSLTKSNLLRDKSPN